MSTWDLSNSNEASQSYGFACCTNLLGMNISRIEVVYALEIGMGSDQRHCGLLES